MINKNPIRLITFSLILLSIAQFSFGASLGDVNENNTVDIIDALMVAQYYVGLSPSPFNPAYADVNCSQSIDIVDALLIAQYYVGLIGGFPCANTPAPTVVPTAVPTSGPYFYSFEGSLEGWEADGTDLTDPVIEWHVVPSTTLAADGYYSLEYYLANLNDAGKIWAVKGFSVTPNQKYNVTIGYRFGTNCYGEIGAFQIITGATSIKPATRDDLIYQESTYNGGVKGYVWLSKSYSFSVTSGADGRIFVAIGIWGNFEVTQIYYVDSVSVAITQGAAAGAGQ
jgi:hypothetical protein